MIGTIINLLIIAAVALLPLGTRYIIAPGNLNGYWEYGTISMYASEVFVALAFLMSALRLVVSFLRRQESIPGNLLTRMGTCLRRCDKLKTVAILILVSLLAYLSYRGHNLGWSVHVLSALLLVVTLRRERAYMLSVSCAFLASVCLQFILGLIQLVTQRVWSSTILGVAAHTPAELGASVVGTTLGRVLRAYGTLPHPNLFGAYMVVAFALALYLLRTTRPSRLHSALMGSAAFFGMGVAISFSRAAWISFVLVIGVAYFSARRHPLIERVSVIGASFIAIAGLTLCFIFWRAAVIPRIFLKKDFGVSERAPLEARSLDERVGSMREAMQMFERHPVLGVGGGNYTRAVHDELDSKRESWGYQPVHNVFLLILCEFGIVGFVALAILLLLYRPQFLLGAIAIIPFLLTDHFLWSLWPGLALFALVWGITKLQDTQQLDA